MRLLNLHCCHLSRRRHPIWLQVYNDFVARGSLVETHGDECIFELVVRCVKADAGDMRIGAVQPLGRSIWPFRWSEIAAQCTSLASKFCVFAGLLDGKIRIWGAAVAKTFLAKSLAFRPLKATARKLGSLCVKTDRSLS